MNSRFDVNDLVQEAQTRWLKPAEVLFILQNHENYQLTEVPPQKPPSGSLLLFNKRVTRFFRKDGHNWRKKKAGRTVREGHERLKVGNVEALNCYYAHGEQNSNFQRRSFWMLDLAYEHIVLVHYREITEGRHSVGLSHISLDSSTISTCFCTAQNQGSISVFSEPYQSFSFSPEFNSESLSRSDGDNHMGETGMAPEASTSSAVNISQTLGRFEQQLSLSSIKLPETSPYSVGNERAKISEVQCLSGRSNQNELVAQQHKSDYREGHQCSSENAGFSPFWTHVKQQLFSEKGYISATLAEGQEMWTSQLMNPLRPRNNAVYENNCHPTVPNDYEPQLSEARQLLLSSDDILSPTTSSLLQDVEYSKVSANTSGTSTHEAVSDFYFDDMDQLEVLFGADSRLTCAQKQRFHIQEISPDWGYATEDTKVIIVGSFLCDPSECTWSCMFGEVEVPMQIIQNGVLCCQAPPHVPGKVTLCITASNRESCSEMREFEYCSKLSICTNCSFVQRDAIKDTEEVLLLVRFVQMLLCNPVVPKEKTVVHTLGISKVDEDPWEQLIDALLVGKVSQLSTKDWLLQELLKDKLQHWLSSKYKEGEPSGCSLSKKEQGIIHLVAGLDFKWALNAILTCGINVNYRDINGSTALHWAARFGREKMVAALIAAGASAGAVTDPSSQDPVGKTPASIAATNGHKGLAGYLSEVALTSHLSSLKLEESDISKGSAAEELGRMVESISQESISSTDDQLSLKESLAAVRKSAQAASRIQSFFRILSFKRRQQREAVAACCHEYGITPDELAATSRLALGRFHDHILDKAALSIQKKYRGWKGRHEFLALRQKIVTIQAHVRGYQVRKRYRVILWAVGILDKIVLRWFRKRDGLRRFQPDSASADEIEYEDILKAFRKLKVDQSVDEALSQVVSMVESPEARQQYRRILRSYSGAKVRK
ncbi:Calmodulin-binding transcription activator [Thalictrum thalictroides]|uniref:Calmodulin-binding transcription activator n=1 Tax=Thalictrum thalictroides TaxID=46969 RepID=A0A7J6UYV9_THATH|nr:Calmodulin-binding transcription activator [Thalictrum thalictroides]